MKLFSITLLAICALAFTACQSAALTTSPTEVFKAQNEARKKKDGAAMKANLSKTSIEMIEKAAKAQNKSIEELLVMELPGMKSPENFEYRNEKIEGDTASVEVKTNLSDEWGKVPFVKEDGRWKLSFDKLIEEATKAQEEVIKSAESSNTATNSNTTNANSANKTNSAK